MSTEFSAENLVGRFREVSPHLKDVPSTPFIAAMDEVSLLVKLLGTALGIAAKDIDEKREILRRRFEELAKRGETEGVADAIADASETKSDDAPAGVRLTLQYLVLDEVDRGVEKTNAGLDSSCARSLLRLMWFLDFVSAMVANMVANPGDELRPSASAAYDATLAAHHPWLLRQTVKAALLTLPHRVTFLENVGGTEANGFKVLTDWKALVDPLREELWSFFGSHGIAEIP